MENNIENKPAENPEPKTPFKSQMSTPSAIIVAGFLIMLGILFSKGSFSSNNAPKTLSEEVGVSSAELNQCIKATDLDALNTSIQKSVSDAIPEADRGTPYSIVIGPNGFKTAIHGAETYDNTKLIVEAAMQGKFAKSGSANLTEPYTGNVALSEPTDHVQGSADAKITIIEYSDFECPYCKMFNPELEKLMKAETPNVRWVYRHYPLHQHSFEELVAANCVGKLKGDDAFFKYGDLLFGLQDQQDTVSGKL